MIEWTDWVSPREIQRLRRVVEDTLIYRVQHNLPLSKANTMRAYALIQERKLNEP